MEITSIGPSYLRLLFPLIKREEAAKTEEQTIRPLEKEIVIELPIPKDQWLRIAAMEATAKEFERLNSSLVAGDIRIVLEKLKETRTMRTKGKNVDNLDLEKIRNLIQQANEKSSKVNLRVFLKRLKSSRTNDSQRE